MEINKGFLHSMGLYGLNSIEDGVLAGLMTGEPILLIGAHGSAKTLLVERIADALGYTFYAYDASKAMFEDVIGFPNPGTISKGIIEYVPTPISIWDKEFILIDEISRASPSMQNKWLEIVRSRRVMGKKIHNLKYIIAAMNPTGYLGSSPLDAALAGRFSFIIKMPEIGDMTLDDIQCIINHIAKDDAPMLATEHYRVKVKTKNSLKHFISRAKKRLQKIKKLYGEFITTYISAIIPEFNNVTYPLNGRRLGMLSRNLVAYLSVKSEKSGSNKFVLKELDELLLQCLNMSLPYQATGEEVTSTTIYNGHKKVMGVLNMESSFARESININLKKNPVEMVKKYEEKCGEITLMEHLRIYTSIEENLARSSGTEEFLLNFIAFQEIVSLYSTGKACVSADLLRRALTTYKKFIVPKAIAMSFLIEEILTPIHFLDRLSPPNIDFNDAVSCIALFIALKMSNISKKGYTRRSIREKTIRLYNTLKNKLATLVTIQDNKKIRNEIQNARNEQIK